MIKKALTEISTISDIDSDNLENYLDALNYLDNVYKLLNILKSFMPLKDNIKFHPSFISKTIAERLGMLTTDEQNEMKYFIAESDIFSSDEETTKTIMLECDEICKFIQRDGNTITFILK